MICLFVWFGLNVAFNNLSVISRRCLDVAGSSMPTFRVLPHWNIMPQTLWHDIPPSHIILTLSWPVLALYFLNAECQAKEQLAPFLKSLVWPGWGSNLQPPGHKADARPLSHCAYWDDGSRHNERFYPMKCHIVMSWITPPDGFEPRTLWSEVKLLGNLDASIWSGFTLFATHSVFKPLSCWTRIYPVFANSADLKKPTDLDLHCLSLSIWIWTWIK